MDSKPLLHSRSADTVGVGRHLFWTGAMMALGVTFIPTQPAVAQSNDDGCVIALVGVLGVFGLAVYDIATAPASARHYNERAVALAPVLDPINRRVGLSVNIRLGGAKSVPVRHSPPLRQRSQKSSSTAFLWSLGATVVPTAVGAVIATSGDNGGLAGVLVASGLLFGPSVGHWYAGRMGRGWATVGARAGTALAFGALGAAVGCNLGD